MDNKLNEKDVKDLLYKSEQFTKLKTITIFGLEFDIHSIIITLLGIILWILIWKYCNIFGVVSYADYFFMAYIIISLLNLLNSSIDASDITSEINQQSIQQSFIQGSLAIFILLFVFLYNFKIDTEDQTDIYRLLAISLLIGCISIIIIDIQNNSINIRLIRKIQQTLYNQALIIFLLALYMFYGFKTSGHQN